MKSQLLTAAKKVQCACTVRERDSGHRTDCVLPELRDAIEAEELKPDPKDFLRQLVATVRHAMAHGHSNPDGDLQIGRTYVMMLERDLTSAEGQL